LGYADRHDWTYDIPANMLHTHETIHKRWYEELLAFLGMIALIPVVMLLSAVMLIVVIIGLVITAFRGEDSRDPTR
jgi:uncharacterized membrane protein